jgi:hypothetical protein
MNWEPQAVNLKTSRRHQRYVKSDSEDESHDATSLVTSCKSKYDSTDEKMIRSYGSSSVKSYVNEKPIVNVSNCKLVLIIVPCRAVFRDI